MNRLEGKVALITGAGSGFGLGIAETFAREGAKVAIIDINEAAAKSAAEKIGSSAIGLAADVSKAGAVNAAVEETVSAFGKLDIVVNNAGISHRNRPMLEVEEDEFDRVFAVNVKSIYLFAKAAVPLMRHQGGGVIVNVGSTAGLRPRPGLTWYNSTKGAVHTMTKSMAVELAPSRIRVCALAPVHGRGYASEARAVRQFDPARPLLHSAGHRQRGALPCLG
jgi:3-oxoacyl-[acyl-carrier protein] reductase